jgi:hypothetical protein
MRPRWNRLQSIPQSVGPAGVEPAFHRVSDGRLAARLRPGRQRPVRDSNPSRLLDRQVATPAASQGGRVSGGSRTRLSDAAGRCLGCSATDTVSKGGRSRTLCACFGGRLLSQEHTLDDQRKGQDSNLQGLSPRPLSKRVPSCLLARPSESGCPGRARTCNRLVNSQPHHRCATGQ